MQAVEKCKEISVFANTTQFSVSFGDALLLSILDCAKLLHSLGTERPHLPKFLSEFEEQPKYCEFETEGNKEDSL